MGLLALAALPGCTAGVASEEPALAADSQPALDVPEGGDLLAADPFSDIGLAQPPRRELASEPATFTDPPAQPVTDTKLAPLNETADVEADFPALVDNAGPTQAGASNDDRLKRLEDRFDAILAELRELKNPRIGLNRPVPENAAVPSQKDAASKFRAAQQPAAAGQPVKEDAARPEAGPVPGTVENMKSMMRGPKPSKTATPQRTGDIEAVTLTRATYKMTPEKAQALAEFLTAYLTDEIEVRVKDGALQVTATREDQEAIEPFIRLLKSKAAIAPKALQSRLDHAFPIAPPRPDPE
jgi:hypothetical protein